MDAIVKYTQKKMGAFLTTLILLLTLICVTGNALEIKKEIAKCSSMKGDLTRLECYDSIAKNIGVDRPKVKSPKVVDSGKWNFQTETNPIDDTKTTLATLQADTGQSRWGNPVTLGILCRSNKLEVYINWNDYLGNTAYVLSRVGSEEAKTHTWHLSSNSQATFFPDNTYEFVDNLVKNEKMVAQITPFNENPLTAIFDIHGLGKGLGLLKENCTWEIKSSDIDKSTTTIEKQP
jgi:type VI secretion system protein VasI